MKYDAVVVCWSPLVARPASNQTTSGGGSGGGFMSFIIKFSFPNILCRLIQFCFGPKVLLFSFFSLNASIDFAFFFIVSYSTQEKTPSCQVEFYPGIRMPTAEVY